jgi:protocatechuate 3,4-dioxygenase, alpha subunit
MKLIPTASQTVGPFFSIGLAPLFQSQPTDGTVPDGAIIVRGNVTDGDKKAIPDAVLEFWSSDGFVRVPTEENGSFHATLKLPAGMRYFDVLVFMRGLLRPVYTRCYFNAMDELRKNESLTKVPTDRLTTLLAHSNGMRGQYEWNIRTQGEGETVFFEF